MGSEVSDSDPQGAVRVKIRRLLNTRKHQGCFVSHCWDGAGKARALVELEPAKGRRRLRQHGGEFSADKIDVQPLG